MELPKSVGVMILPNVNLFPHAVLPLFIFEPRYRRMLRDSLESHRLFCVAMQRPEASRESPSRVAGLGLITASVENPDGTSNMMVQGIARVSLGRVLKRRPYRVHAIEALVPSGADTPRIDALSVKVRELVGQRFRRGLPTPLKTLGETSDAEEEGTPGPEQLLKSLTQIGDASVLADLVSCTLLSDPAQRQVLLETVDLETRLRYLIYFLIKDLEEAGGACPET